MRPILLVPLSLMAACAAPPADALPGDTIAEPAAADVAAILLLVGDAGEATVDGSPVLHRLRQDVEHWSGALEGDAPVRVLFLGDNVYPAGVREPSEKGFDDDTLHLSAQLWAAEGPKARAHGAQAVFLPGNHDWGNLRGAEGIERLRSEASVIDAWAAAGRPVHLEPEPGSPGPAVLDLGAGVVVILDTEWLLQSPDTAARTVALDSLGNVLFASLGRPVILAGHHPWASVGPHGERGRLDPARIFARGSLVQDLDSKPYTEMIGSLSRLFAQSDRPLAFVGGHDHALEVLRTAGPGRPGWTLVSGAGSKLSPVAEREDVAWAGSEPGYMRLVFTWEGSVLLFVESAPPSTRWCDDGPGQQACIERGVAAYRTLYSTRLR